ncbi:MAG: F0F1 ATP synthase subunit A [Actinobacteria bacterium]|nr:F0F1 ATP synthase subunit A [Actinomycetota bacterium]
MILASGACDPAADIICKPENVNELFEFTHPLFSIGPFDFTRTVFLTFLAMVIVLAFLYFGLRKTRVVPSRFGVLVESAVGFVRDDIAKGVIGPEGGRYVPYLLAMFLFLLVANLFEVTPGINFPITSRMAIPVFLSLLTWVIFVVVGFFKNGFRYVLDIIWPKSVPIGLRWLVGIIELVSTFLLRPLTLAVRLFANMVAGHLMLTLLLVSGWVFMSSVGDIGARSIIGLPWFVFGLGIYLFEIVVAVLQAYIFTLLSAVYIQSSVHPEH